MVGFPDQLIDKGARQSTSLYENARGLASWVASPLM